MAQQQRKERGHGPRQANAARQGKAPQRPAAPRAEAGAPRAAADAQPQRTANTPPRAKAAPPQGGAARGAGRKKGGGALRREKSCGAVCVCGQGGEQRVLLVRHLAGGRWAFPKGHTEPGETEQQTALREVAEETGVAASLLAGFRFVTNYSPVRGTIKKVVYFAARCAPTTPRPQPGEIRDARFFAPEEALRRLTYPADKRLLRKALRFLAGAGDAKTTAAPTRHTGADSTPASPAQAARHRGAGDTKTGGAQTTAASPAPARPGRPGKPRHKKRGSGR